MKIRLLLIIPTLDRGGAEKQTTLLAAGLPREDFDVRVCLLTRGGPLREALDAAGIPIVEIHKRGKLDPFAFRRLRRVMREFEPHVVHTWLFAANAYGRLAAMRERVPVILGGERCVDPWKRGHELAIDRYLARRSRAILTNSRGVVSFYASKGIPADRFVVIPNGINVRDDVDPSEARRVLLKELGLAEPVRLIAAVGRLWPQKRHKDLIWATELVNAVRDDVHLVVIGEGPERWRLERFAHQIPIDHRVHFLGRRDDVPRLMPGFDQLWNGSGYEGQSNSVLEAMSLRVPVVVSDIPGNRDLVSHGEDGLAFPVGDRAQLARCCLQLLDDPDRSAAMAERARAKVIEEFTVERMVRRHAEIYRRFLTETGR